MAARGGPGGPGRPGVALGGPARVLARGALGGPGRPWMALPGSGPGLAQRPPGPARPAGLLFPYYMADLYLLVGLSLRLHEAEHVLVSLYGDSPRLLAYFRAKKDVLGPDVRYCAFTGYNCVEWHNSFAQGSLFADPDYELDMLASAGLEYELKGCPLTLLYRPTASRASYWDDGAADVFIGFCRFLRQASYYEIGDDSVPSDYSVEFADVVPGTGGAGAAVLARFGPVCSRYIRM